MLDLCAGIGGISLGAHMAGIETVAFCEIEPFPQKILRKRWPNIPIFDDVRKLNRQVLIDSGVIRDGSTIDIISGGYPCQPFSLAGKRRGAEDDRHLWPEFKRLIQEIRPRWFVGENVAGHVTMGLDDVLADLETIDYSTQAFVIPACAVNAPHRRERVFIVANANSIGNNSTEEHRVNGNWQEEMQERIEPQRGLTDNGENVPYTNSPGQPERGCKEPAGWSFFGGYDYQGSRWRVEPDVGRVVNGVPNRVDRLKALGNAVVPAQIYPIFKAIMEIERMT